MKFLSSAFLVLLRLAIGWHFLVEGVFKLNDASWTSAPYLREASGPLAGQFRDLAGDAVVDKMIPLAADDSGKGTYRQRLPRALASEWQVYFDRFVAYYENPPEKPGQSEEQRQQLKLTEEQKRLAQARLEQRQEQTAQWLIEGKKTVVKPSQFKQLPRETERTTRQRVDDYQAAVKEVRRIEQDELPRMGDAALPKLAAAKADAARQRAELLGELNEQTAALKVALLGRDGYLQSIPGSGPASVLSGEWKGEKGILTPEQTAKIDPLPDTAPLTWKSRWQTARSLEWLSWSRLQWSDFLVRWGLIAVGGLLILGLFTRTACIAGAIYLVLFYLPMPPWPGLPESPRSEGHYLYINKNIIEALALMALAFTSSGRWVGIDGLLSLRKGREKAEEASAEPKRETPVDLGRATPRPDLEPALAANGPAAEHTEQPPELKHDKHEEPPTVLYTANPKEPSHGD